MFAIRLVQWLGWVFENKERKKEIPRCCAAELHFTGESLPGSAHALTQTPCSVGDSSGFIPWVMCVFVVHFSPVFSIDFFHSGLDGQTSSQPV